jgi:hypothetical protein
MAQTSLRLRLSLRCFARKWPCQTIRKGGITQHPHDPGTELCECSGMRWEPGLLRVRLILIPGYLTYPHPEYCDCPPVLTERVASLSPVSPRLPGALAVMCTLRVLSGTLGTQVLSDYSRAPSGYSSIRSTAVLAVRFFSGILFFH